MTRLSRPLKIILIIAFIAALLCIVAILAYKNFRYYTAKSVNTHFEAHELYSCKETDETVKEDGILAKHNSKRFRSVCIGSNITREEVLDRFGKPHALFGSGLIYDVYFTTDNQLVYILYNNGCVESIREVPLE